MIAGALCFPAMTPWWLTAENNGGVHSGALYMCTYVIKMLSSSYSDNSVLGILMHWAIALVRLHNPAAAYIDATITEYTF